MLILIFISPQRQSRTIIGRYEVLSIGLKVPHCDHRTVPRIALRRAEQLEASVHGQAAGQPWACVTGPADFDASEALSLLPVVGEGDLPGMCGADAGTSGAFCSRPLGDDCSPSPLQSNANICTLDGGIGFACNPCGLGDAGQNCGLQSALVRGARYSYVQILNVDVAFIYVYDPNNTLVAKLSWSANSAVTGQPWSCAAGPADFDPTEAKSLLPARSSALLCTH